MIHRIILVLLVFSHLFSNAQESPCDSFELVECENPISFVTEVGPGHIDFPNIIGESCYTTISIGGGEKIYKYTASSSGTFNIQILETEGNTMVDYFYKDASLDPCNGGDWNCLGNENEPTFLNAINLNEGQEIWILLNSESDILPANHTWKISCSVPFACSEIVNITCGDSYPFNVEVGIGNVEFNEGITANCVSNNFSGGGRIYSFSPEIIGTYVIRPTELTFNEYIDILIKPTSQDPCSPLGWQCINNLDLGEPPYAFEFDLSTTEDVWIYILSYYYENPANFSFEIDCGTPFACENINEFSCGEPVSFISNAAGGSAAFGPSTALCFSLNRGQEQIYRFNPPQSGYYTFEVLSSNSNAEVNYAYKNANGNPCISTGWNCIESTNEVDELESLYLSATNSYYFIAAAASEDDSVNVTFQLRCAELDPCFNLLPIACGENIEFTTTQGIGKSNFTNETNCSASEIIGGKEKFYTFLVPEDGDYQFEAITAPTAGPIQYLLTTSAQYYCSSGPHYCIGKSSSAGFIGAAYLSAGQLVYIACNSETTDANHQIFRMNCATQYPCNELTMINCNEPTLFEVEPGASSFVSSGVYGTNNLGPSYGLEKVYAFQAPEDGNYYVRTLSDPTNGAISFYRTYFTGNGSLCSDLNLDLVRTVNSIGEVSSIYLSQNQYYYFVISSQSEQGNSVLFQIDCAINRSCEDIYNVSCGSNIETYIEPGFSNSNMLPSSCNQFPSSGREKVYRFIPPTTGNYFFSVTSTMDDTFFNYSTCQYFGSTCFPASHSCLGNAVAPGIIGEKFLEENDTIYIIVRTQERLFPTSQTFTISCIDKTSLPVISTLNSPICNGSNDGEITISVLGGSGTYTYDWADLEGTNDVANRTGISAGTYHLKVTDTSGNISENDFLIHEYNAIVIYEELTLPSAPDNSDGAISLITYSENGPIMLDWLDINESSELLQRNDLASQSYCAIATDAAGCSVDYCADLTYAPTQPLGISYVIDYATCNGDTLSHINVTVTGGTPPYIHDWSDLNENLTNSDRGYLPAGIYSLTVTDSNGLTANESFNLTDPVRPIIIGTALNFSYGYNTQGGIEVGAYGGTPPYSFDWDHISGVNNPSFLTELNTGQYCVTLSDALGCFTDTCFTIATDQSGVNQGLACLVTQLTCHDSNDGAIDVSVPNASSILNYNWLDIPGFSNVQDRTNLAPGGYMVEVTDAFENTLHRYLVIEEKEPFVMTDIEITESTGDNDGQINFVLEGGTLPYQVQWSDLPNPSINTSGRYLLFPGTYCVTAYDFNGCAIEECFEVPLYSSVNETNTTIDFQIVPNPVSNEFRISSSEELQIQKIEIYNVLGELVLMDSSPDAIYQFNVSPGLYNAVITTSKGIFNQKIIKK